MNKAYIQHIDFYGDDKEKFDVDPATLNRGTSVALIDKADEFGV